MLAMEMLPVMVTWTVPDPNPHSVTDGVGEAVMPVAFVFGW
jgi:hypothetical protein